MKLKVTVRGVPSVIRALARRRADVQRVVNEEVLVSAINIQRVARVAVPVDTGLLRSRILIEQRVEGARQIASVGTFEGGAEHYGPDVEFGTRPHWPPRKALEGWARRHGVPVFLVARAIARRGTRPQPFLGPAFRAEVPGFVSRLRESVTRVIEQGPG